MLGGDVLHRVVLVDDHHQSVPRHRVGHYTALRGVDQGQGHAAGTPHVNLAGGRVANAPRGAAALQLDMRSGLRFEGGSDLGHECLLRHTAARPQQSVVLGRGGRCGTGSQYEKSRSDGRRSKG